MSNTRRARVRERGFIDQVTSSGEEKRGSKGRGDRRAKKREGEMNEREREKGVESRHREGRWIGEQIQSNLSLLFLSLSLHSLFAFSRRVSRSLIKRAAGTTLALIVLLPLLLPLLCSALLCVTRRLASSDVDAAAASTSSVDAAAMPCHGMACHNLRRRRRCRCRHCSVHGTHTHRRSLGHVNGNKVT